MRDGLVVEHWADRDDLDMPMQLGWFDPSESSTAAYVSRRSLGVDPGWDMGSDEVGV